MSFGQCRDETVWALANGPRGETFVSTLGSCSASISPASVRIVQLRRRRVASVLFEMVTSPFDVIFEDARDLAIHVRSNDDAQAVDFLSVRRHRVRRQNPAALADLVGNIELVVAGHGFVERERNHGNTLRLVKHLEPSGLGEPITLVLRMLKGVLHDARILSAESENRIVLHGNVCGALAEIQSGGRGFSAQIVNVKHQIL
jgi:hypothetical protein